jgi:hypothetical protein
MLGGPLDRGHEPQRVTAREPVAGDDVDERGAAAGQGAGLVQRDGADPAEVLERLAALDEHAAARGTADGRDDADGHGDDEGARAGDDEQRQRAVQPGVEVAAGQRGHHGDERGGEHHQRRVPAGEAVDEALGRRLGALGVGDELRDAGQGAVPRGRGDRDGERPLGVQGAGEHPTPLLLVRRHRLAGQGRLVDARAPGDDRAVEGDALARADEDVLADEHLVDGDGALGVALQHAGLRWREVHELLDRPAAAVHGERLERRADGEEHEHPGRLGEVPDGHGPDGGQRHQDRHVEAAAPHRRRRRQQDRPSADRHGAQEEPVGRAVRAAGQQRDDDGGQEQHHRGARRGRPSRSPPERCLRCTWPAGQPGAEARARHGGLDRLGRGAPGDEHRRVAERDVDRLDAVQAGDHLADGLGARGAVHPVDAEALGVRPEPGGGGPGIRRAGHRQGGHAATCCRP